MKDLHEKQRNSQHDYSRRILREERVDDDNNDMMI